MSEKNHLINCKFIAALLVATVCTVIAGAVNPYPTLKAKAERFFDHQEWASAAAMFDLMLEEHPDIIQMITAPTATSILVFKAEANYSIGK